MKTATANRPLIRTLLLTALVGTAGVAQGQGLGQVWARCFGSTSSEFGNRIDIAPDSGAFVAGVSYQAGGDIPLNKGLSDMCVLKVDKNGANQWLTVLGGSQGDGGSSVAATPDGGCYVVGRGNSTDGNFTGNHGGSDLLVARLSASGSVSWARALGGSAFEDAFDCALTPDGGCIVIGSTDSHNGDVSGKHDTSDVWVVKLSPGGVIDWAKCYGGSGVDLGFAITPTADSGYVFVAETASSNGDVSGRIGDADSWVVKIDSAGAIMWQKCVGGSQYDTPFDVTQAADGSLYLCGSSRSSDAHFTTPNKGATDGFVSKLTPSGTVSWTASFGGSGKDHIYGMGILPGGDLALLGATESANGDVQKRYAGSDGWLLRVDPNTHALKWTGTFGGGRNDVMLSLAVTPAGELITSGWSNSEDFDVAANHNAGLASTDDIWLMQLANGLGATPAPAAAAGISIFPTLVTDRVNVSFGTAAGAKFIAVADLNGKTIHSAIETGSLVSIDLSGLAAGQYLVQATMGSGTFSRLISKR